MGPGPDSRQTDAADDVEAHFTLTSLTEIYNQSEVFDGAVQVPVCVYTSCVCVHFAPALRSAQKKRRIAAATLCAGPAAELVAARLAGDRGARGGRGGRPGPECACPLPTAPPPAQKLPCGVWFRPTPPALRCCVRALLRAPTPCVCVCHTHCVAQAELKAYEEQKHQELLAGRPAPLPLPDRRRAAADRKRNAALSAGGAAAAAIPGAKIPLGAPIVYDRFSGRYDRKRNAALAAGTAAAAGAGGGGAVHSRSPLLPPAATPKCLPPPLGLAGIAGSAKVEPVNLQPPVAAAAAAGPGGRAAATAGGGGGGSGFPAAVMVKAEGAGSEEGVKRRRPAAAAEPADSKRHRKG